MLGIPVRYLARHPLSVAELAIDPVELWMNMVDVYVAERELRRAPCPYECVEDWECRLHNQIGAPWPCPSLAEYWSLWPEVMNELKANGVQAGPQSFGSWNDGDAALVRTIWCLIRHLKPQTVVETGVAHGVTSRFILEALARNGEGHLWSIDLPPIQPFWKKQVGMAVGDRFKDRWSYVKGSSRRRLPELLSRLREIDLFIHDSLHSERNVRFELDRAWPVLRKHGAIVVDDVDANWGFQSFSQAFSGHASMVCKAEPLRPDLRRFNQKGLFGIVLKQPASQA